MDTSKIDEAARRLSASDRLVVLTGAGVSKESGVPTFRDAMDGLWARFDPQQLATPAAFRANPKLVWDWYQYRRELVGKAKPNAGHFALAQLEDLLAQVVIVTQNVDGFHQAAGSTDVVTLHGDINRNKCFDDCQGNPTLIDIGQLQWDRESGPPLCPHCGAYVRPDVVWFTERLPLAAFNRAEELTDHADVMLVIGTSGMVQPAALLPYRAKRYAGAYLIDVNPNEDEISAFADLHIAAPSGEALPRIVEAMRKMP